MNLLRHILIPAVAAKSFSAFAQETNSPDPKTNAPGVRIRSYQMEGNTILAPENFDVLTNYTGTNVTFARLREGLGTLQLRYHELGYSTISVTLPQQKLTNGIVRVKIVEGKLNQIKITGNKYFSAANIRRALPSLATNVLLNTRWFQPELDAANQNRDRQIYPVISPGYEPGTTELELKVKDQMPLHWRSEVNDKSSPGSPLLRSDTSIQYANLWQREHQIGFDYNFSPQRFKGEKDADTLLDLPMVSSYSAFYRLPLGSRKGQRDQIEKQPTTFGYDEVNHRFNMPPPSGHPDLTFYASRSSSDTPLQFGPRNFIFTNTLADISSQFVQHSPSINNNAGLKLNWPLPTVWKITSALSLGMDFKSYESKTFSTNNTYFDLYALDTFGNRVLLTNQTVSLAANSRQSLCYLPISYGWIGTRPDKTGSTTFLWNQSIFLPSLSSSRKDFQNVAGDKDAGGTYTTINAGLIRQQQLSGEWSATLNLNGQWASAPLINNEQFGLGGTAGVRGYEEGEVYGDSGWRALFDLRAPPVNIGYFPTQDGEFPAIVRCSWFLDYGQIYDLDRSAWKRHSVSELGTGLSFFLTAGEHFDARLTLAWALSDLDQAASGTTGPELKTGQGNLHAYFAIGAQF